MVRLVQLVLLAHRLHHAQQQRVVRVVLLLLAQLLHQRAAHRLQRDAVLRIGAQQHSQQRLRAVAEAGVVVEVEEAAQHAHVQRLQLLRLAAQQVAAVGEAGAAQQRVRGAASGRRLHVRAHDEGGGEGLQEGLEGVGNGDEFGHPAEDGGEGEEGAVKERPAEGKDIRRAPAWTARR